MEGMTITGKIKNVVDFGAFVDLGIKETALVHISEMSDHFIKDPIDTVKVGDVLEFRIINLDRDRRRIGLSRKSPGGAPPVKGDQTKGGGLPGEKARGGKPEGKAGELRGDAGGKKRVVTVKKPGDGTAGQGPLKDRERPPKDDDGTMYNPFAEAFRKAQKKKERTGYDG
jgi:uncharacterized protein